MASSSTTSDRNINIEGSTNNNTDNKEGMNSTGNNNDISEDHAIVFVAYNGKWEYDDKEWFFKNSRSSIMVVPKHVTLTEITGILYKQLKVNKKLYRLKLEVHYRTGSPWFPVTEIQNNQDLSVFISVTSKTKLPLCVTQIYDEFTNVVQDRVTSGVDEERRKDVAYELINGYPSLATTVYRDKTVLDCIIRKPELFYCGTSYSFYSRFVYQIVPIKNNSLGSNDTADVENQETRNKDKFVTKHTRKCLHTAISRICVKLWETTLLHVLHIKHLKDDKVKHNTTIKLLRRICEEADRTHTSSDIERLYSSPFCLAVENNNAEALDVLTTYFAGLYASKKDGHNIYQLTVLNRSERVYNYILHHGYDIKNDFSISIDDDGNNILHLVGCLAPIHKLNAASGAALQMQRELQWFEEVKRVVGITKTQELNKNKETPMMVFRREHEKLRKDGEEWMKKTADSYTITAALIITIVFAAAITVPGGNDDKTGKPIYETEASLIIFAISDAISLFTSTTSLLLFLSILTARYADEDFLYKLPKRLIYGLVMLFVSVTSMMIAFSATLYIMFGQGKPWILFPIAALACLPIASFVTLQFPLLVELISSTYGHGILGKKKDHRLSANANIYDY
ncbi:ankyrin repeat family protein [Artemisia annua]|uniref:Ankyrin repeat family protein n=1 Tax=Artemisia annua TaxID=35608 RepID=A0A2U1P7G4_ARTAN|nr:ankyrin repeat family protein [Artemisia annua]